MRSALPLYHLQRRERLLPIAVRRGIQERYRVRRAPYPARRRQSHLDALADRNGPTLPVRVSIRYRPGIGRWCAHRDDSRRRDAQRQPAISATHRVDGSPLARSAVRSSV